MTAALVAPYFIDWTSYRGDFEREASAILGRKVSVDGAAEARLLPFPSVSFSNVSVGGGTGGEPAMTVDKFSMDAELAPFLSGEFLIFDMRLERPRVRVSIGADGNIDWAVRPSTPVDASRIEVERLTVSDGAVEIRHEAGGRTHTLSDVDLTISARSLAGPWRIDGTLLADGLRTAVAASTGVVAEDGSLRLKMRAEPERPSVTVDTDGTMARGSSGLTYRGDFRIAEAVPAPQPSTSAVATVRVPAYRVTGDFSLGSARLDVPRYRFETGPLDDPYVAEGTADVALGETPRFDVKATGAQVRLDAAAGADAALSLDERLRAVREALAVLPRPAIPGAISVDLPAVLLGDTTIRDVKLAAEPVDGGWRLGSFAATMPGRTTLEARGTLKTEGAFDFEGNLLLAVRQPSGFAAWVAKDIDEAIRKLPSAGFSARVSVSERRQTFRDLELVLGQARFRGEIDARQPDGLRPSIFLKLDGGALDVDGLSAFASLFVSDAGRNRFSESDLDFQVKAGPVSVAKLTADSVDTALRLRSGSLEIDRLAVSGLAGAAISATGSVKDFAGSPSGNIDASILSDDLAPLLALLQSQYPRDPVIDGLTRRVAAHPDLARNARLDVVASAAVGAGGAPGVAVSMQGEAGGSALSLSLSTESMLDPTNAAATVIASARNEDSGLLLALAGLPALPLGTTGAGELSIEATGVPANGLQTRAQLKAVQFDALFDGRTTLSAPGLAVKGKASILTDDLEPWLMTVGRSLPGMGFGMPVEVAADLDGGDGVLILSRITGTVSEMAVAGDLNVRIDAGLPKLTGALTLDSLALDPLAAILFGEAAFLSDDGRWPTAPFSTATSVPFEADLNVAAATVTAGDYTAYDASLDLHLGLDGLRIDDAAATLLEGRARGRLGLRANDGQALFDGRIAIEGGDLTRLFGDAVGGAVDVTAEVAGEGKSVSALVSSLTGSGRALVHTLRIDGLNAGAFPGLVAQADNAGRDIDAARIASFAPGLLRSGVFEAGPAELAFSVSDGILRAPPVSLTGKNATMTVDLRADLSDLSVGATGTLSFEPGEEAIAGMEPSVRFALAGPLTTPKTTLDTEPLGQFLMQRALEREQARVDALQAVLLERQRLRREVRYYAALQADRDRLAEEARRAELEARRKAEAEAKAAQEAEEKARAERARQEEEERRRLEDEQKLRDEEAARKAADTAPSAAEQAPIVAPPTGDQQTVAPERPAAAPAATADEGQSAKPGSNGGAAPSDVVRPKEPPPGPARSSDLPGAPQPDTARVSGEEAVRAAMEADGSLRRAQERTAASPPQVPRLTAPVPDAVPQPRDEPRGPFLLDRFFRSLSGN